MRTVLIALLMLSIAVPAYARGSGKRSNTDQANSADTQKKSREEEKAYKDALRRIPNAKPADPWGKMR